MVEDPLLALQEGIRGSGGEVRDVVEIPDDPVRLPLDCVGVVGVGDRPAQVDDLAVARPAGVPGAMQGAEHLVGRSPHVLHDVDLARLRPADPVDVGAEHPERGPQAGARRHLDAGLDPAVGHLEPVLGHQPRRGVLARAVGALQRSVGGLGGDHQVALAVGGGVGAALGVVLKLVVAPARDAVGGAVADLVGPAARVRCRATLGVELVAPRQLPLRGRDAGPGFVVGEVHGDVRALVPAVVPEAQIGGVAPVLCDREGAVERVGALLRRLIADLQDVLPVALAGQGHGAAGRELGVGQLRLVAGPPEVGECLEVVEQGCVVQLVVEDVDARDRRQPHRRAAGRVGQLDEHTALTLVLAVVDRLHGERLLGDVGREGQGARDRFHVVTVRGRGPDRGRVLDRHRAARGLAELGGHRCDGALGHVVVERAEADGQGPDRGHTVDRRVIDVVGLRGRRRDRAQGPAVHLGQAEAVVGRAVADLLAGQARERDLDLLPAAEVVREAGRPALGVVLDRAGVAVVEHVHEQGRAAVVAMQPEGDPRVGAPVLGDPRVDRAVLEGVGEAREGDDVEIQLEHVVAARGAGPGVGRGARCRCDGDAGGRVRVLERVEPDRDPVGVDAGREPGLEVVDDRERRREHRARGWDETRTDHDGRQACDQ